MHARVRVVPLLLRSCSFCGVHTTTLCPAQASSKRDILDLKKHLNKPVLVKFTGGREGSTRRSHACEGLASSR